MSGNMLRLFVAGAVLARLFYVWRIRASNRACTAGNLQEIPYAEPRDHKLQTRSRFRSGQDKSRVLCCRSVREYTACINETIKSDDNVLVINTTDKDDNFSSLITQRARNSIIFRGQDVWDVQHLQLIGTVSVVCINYTDAFGNFLLCDTVTMIRLLRSVFKPNLRDIIIKDKGLSCHADSYVAFDVFRQDHQRIKQISSKHLTPIVICAVGVSQYRMTIPYIVEKGDKVLEIGCARGTTVALAAEYVGSADDGGLCVGIDMGKVCIENSRKDYRELLEKNCHVRFEIGNGWDIPSLTKIAENFNVIFVDIGGISGSDGELEGISFLRQLMCVYGSREPIDRLRYIVVKSRCLRDHALTFCTAGKFLLTKAEHGSSYR